MDLNKCSRCGAFHVGEGDVCPRCTKQENIELSAFKTYIDENGFSSIDTISAQTGISQKNVSRFISYQSIDALDIQGENLTNTGIILN